MLTILFFAIFFLMLSAFFSGSEIAFVSANKLKIQLMKERGTISGKVISSFYDKPRDFISTMLVGNNIALVVLTYLMSKLIEPLLYSFTSSEVLILLISTMIITVIVLIFGEFMPKTIFRIYSDRILSFFALPLQFFKGLFLPLTYIMTKLTALVLRFIFKSVDEEAVEPFNRIDLEELIEQSFVTGEAEEQSINPDLFRNALHVRNVKVKEAMVPRNEIVAVDINSSMEDLIKLFDKSKLSRILIHKGDIDEVVGYIHHQQMIKQPKDIVKAILSIPFVPEVMGALDLLNLFIKRKKNIACVVNEYGAISGVITLEDILEEIFGEIEDEHDKEDYIEEQISENEWLFSGRLEIDYLNEKYANINFPEGDFNTLSGYIVTTTANIPEEGDSLELDGFQFILEKVSNTKIELIRVYKLAEDEND